MKRCKITALLLSAVMAGCSVTAGCGKKTETPANSGGPSTLVPIGDNSSGISFQGVPSTVEETLEVFSSADGACRIEKKASYYDVYLDYEKADHYSVGKAFGETILKAYPEYPEVMEPYLFENIYGTFGNLSDYSAVQARVDRMLETLDEDYLMELKGFCDGVSTGEKGFVKDGRISYDEACLFQFVPDVLRPTSCSTITVNGKKTATGQRLAARLLEWQLGTENQICTAHSVMHVKNGEKSYTAVAVMGMMSILTAVNDDGVFTGELDVGSAEGNEYDCDGRRSYTYAIRYALENFDNAREAGEYMVENAEDFTFNVNVFFNDKNDAVCVEVALDEDEGTALLRDSSTPLHKGMVWDDPNVFCCVNSFAAAGNADQLTNWDENIVRWNKYNKYFCHEDNIDLARFKELLTFEDADNRYLVKYRGSGLVHMAVVDWSDNSIHVNFTTTDGVNNEPEFVRVGTFD